MQVGFPFTLDGRGRVASPDYNAHVRQLIEQVLFTSPGQRVNRPGFGAGVLELVYGSMSDELLTASELMIQGALERWLGEVIRVEAVRVKHQESQLQVWIEYVVRRDLERHTALFEPTEAPWRP